MSQGVNAFEPGLLARANRGVLYIDEVILLEDHQVDLLIHVDAPGKDVLEREGLADDKLRECLTEPWLGLCCGLRPYWIKVNSEFNLVNSVKH